MPKNNFFIKLKQDRGARAIAVTILALLLVLSSIILTTVIANRAAKNKDPLPDGSEQVGVLDPGPDTDPTPPAEGDKTPADNGEEQKTDTLPSHFLLPVSGVLQKKHDAALQTFSPTMGDYRVHLGIDIGTVAGANVSAMADGVITQVWEDVSMGKCVAVKHGGEAYTVYKNLAAELPESTAVGRSVKAGDVIGYVGESAMVEVADEPHLHVEMTVNGLQVDPTEYLDEDARATLNEDTDFEDVS